jgi:hypothetical protein
MLYTRPRMGTLFYFLGCAGLMATPVAALTGMVLYLEARGFTKDDLATAMMVALAIFLGSLLILGMASILNVLHDIRAELSRSNQLAGRGEPAALRSPAEPPPSSPPPRPPTTRRFETV